MKAHNQLGRPTRRAMAHGCLVLALTGVLAAAPAVFAGTPDTATAKTLFKAGAQAYAENNFLAALHAFDAARAIVPDPALTFSIAQSHRRQYAVDGKAVHLRAALTEFQRYLTEVKEGGRRGDASEAVLELEPKVAELAKEGTGTGAEAPTAPARVATRLMVLSSVTGAEVRVDSGPTEKAPFIGEIEPGAHIVRVEADGYRPYVRTIQARAGDVVPIDAALEDLPAELLVQGEAGATVWIDGHAMGALPLSTPLSITPGRRLLCVTKDGYRRYELETRLERGERKDLGVELETTTQRPLSIAAMALGGGSLLAGAIFAGVAADQYSRTKDVYDRAQAGNIDGAELTHYDETRGDHQPWVVAAVVTGGVGLTLGVVGGLLFLFDTAPAPSQVEAVEPTRSESPSVTVGFVPSPLGAELGARGEF